MFAIIRDLDKVVVGQSDFQPDPADLDSRGELAIETSETFSVGDIYDPASETFAPQPETLEQAQTRKITELRTACEAVITAGVSCNALGADHTYPTTRDDQANLDSEVTTAKLYGAPEGPYHFWCVPAGQEADPMAWSRIEHTAGEIEVVGLAVRQHVKDQQANYEAKRAAALAASDVAGVDGVVW